MPQVSQCLVKEAIVTAFTFTADDLKSAPVEVRRWLIGRIETGLAIVASLPPISPLVHGPALAACTIDDVARIFELIRSDFAATQVFLELGRGTTGGDPAPQLHPINIDTLTRNTRLDSRGLVSCLQMINRAYQEVRSDPEATLSGFDQANHVYVHEATHRSIHSLRQELVRQHIATEVNAAEPADWPPAGFQPPQPGPSEDVATHRQH
jgi:hypothetical protein